MNSWYCRCTWSVNGKHKTLFINENCYVHGMTQKERLRMDKINGSFDIFNLSYGIMACFVIIGAITSFFIQQPLPMLASLGIGFIAGLIFFIYKKKQLNKKYEKNK